MNYCKNLLKNHKNLIYILSFFTVSFLLFLAYQLSHISPKAENSVLVLDLHGQYVYYYEYLKDALLGKHSLIYSWSRNLSGNMFGIITTYLTSPFILIVCLFPHSMITFAIELMQILKAGTAAVTIGIYLKKKRGCSDYCVFITSIMYALSSYFVVELMNPMWLDAVIMLPLVIYATEVLIEKEKSGMFIITLSITFIANYYTGYMVGIFVGIYFLLYYLFFNIKGLKNFIRIFCRFFISVVITILTSMIVLLPTYKALSLGKIGLTSPDMSWKNSFSYSQFFSKLIPTSYDTVRPNALPMIACGLIALVLIPLFFLNKKIDRKKKIFYALLLYILFLIMYINPLNIAMHGFAKPNWLEYRYSFLFTFVMVVICAESLYHIKDIALKHIIITTIIDAGLLGYLAYKKYSYISIVVPIIILTIYLILLFIYTVLKKKDLKICFISIALLVVAETFYTTKDTMKKIDKDLIYSSTESYTSKLDPLIAGYKELQEADDSLYRTEKTYFRTVNDNMTIGMKGLSHSSSTMNSDAIDFLYKLGFVSKFHLSKYDGNTKFSDSMLGIKYIFSSSGTVQDYPLFMTTNGYSVYKNPEALSIAYLADNRIKDIELDKINPFINQNRLATDLSGNDEDIFRYLSYTPKYENVSISYVAEHNLYRQEDTNLPAKLSYDIDIHSDEMVYLYIPTVYEHKVKIYVNGAYKKEHFTKKNYGIVTLGSFAPNQKINVTIELTDGKFYMQDIYFYQLNNNAYANVMNTLKQGQLNITDYTDTEIKGTINADEKKYVFTSIPYEEGFKITVDGKKVEPVKLAGAMLGFEIDEGNHDITIKYTPTYFYVSIIISIIGIALLVLTILYDKRKKLE